MVTNLVAIGIGMDLRWCRMMRTLGKKKGGLGAQDKTLIAPLHQEKSIFKRRFLLYKNTNLS